MSRSSTTTCRVNVGCGSSPTPGWVNLDNSVSVRLGRWEWVFRLLRRAGLVNEQQAGYARTARAHGVRWGRATHLPLEDGSVDVLYSSHMLEHLGQRSAAAFLAEARRVLRPSGVIRIAVPDLRRLAAEYLHGGDANGFLNRTLLAPDLEPLWPRLLLLGLGPRHHQWMYDSDSLVQLLDRAGFRSVTMLSPGDTTIEDPGALDLREREGDSIYVEARQPSA